MQFPKSLVFRVQEQNHAFGVRCLVKLISDGATHNLSAAFRALGLSLRVAGLRKSIFGELLKALSAHGVAAVDENPREVFRGRVSPKF